MQFLACIIKATLLKKSAIILIVIVFIGCTEKITKSTNDIVGFNTFLGNKKANVLNDASTSFNEFLI